MIIDRIDDIIADIEANIRYGNTVGATYDIDWASWDNDHNRVLILMHSRRPVPPLNSVDMFDAVNRVGIVWGVRSYSMIDEGVIMIESIRMIGEEFPVIGNIDVLDDDIIK